MEPHLDDKPGWLRREFEATAKEIAKWPKPMRDQTAFALYRAPTEAHTAADASMGRPYGG